MRAHTHTHTRVCARARVHKHNLQGLHITLLLLLFVEAGFQGISDWYKLMIPLSQTPVYVIIGLGHHDLLLHR